MKEFPKDEICIRAFVRNNRLYKLIYESGFSDGEKINVAAFSRKVKVGESIVGSLLNLKISPVYEKSSRHGKVGEYISAALKIARYFKVEVEELFPLEMYEKVVCSSTERSASLEQFPKILALVENYFTETPSGMPVSMKIIGGNHE